MAQEREGDGVLDWLKLRSTRAERGLAWHAQIKIATRAPFAVTVGRSVRHDSDSPVGEAVYDSAAVYDALVKLANGLAPDRRITATVVDALAAVSELLTLRPSWVAYCDESFNLDSQATDSHSEMCRLRVSGDRTRAWPRFAEAKTAFDRAAEALAQLQPELAHFCGKDITVRSRKTDELLQQAVA